MNGELMTIIVNSPTFLILIFTSEWDATAQEKISKPLQQINTPHHNIYKL